MEPDEGFCSPCLISRCGLTPGDGNPTCVKNSPTVGGGLNLAPLKLDKHGLSLSIQGHGQSIHRCLQMFADVCSFRSCTDHYSESLSYPLCPIKIPNNAGEMQSMFSSFGKSKRRCIYIYIIIILYDIIYYV